MNQLITDLDMELQEKQDIAQKSYLLVPIEEVLPNTWNPNKLDEIDFEKLKNSIEADGGNKN